MPSAAAEIALARTAGPSSISAHAEVLVLTKQGYVVGAKGTNGWVCWVGRSWTAGLDDPEFWNWRGLGPVCLNPPAVRSVLPQYIARTKWAIAGDTRRGDRCEVESRLRRPPIHRSRSRLVWVHAIEKRLPARRRRTVASACHAVHRVRPTGHVGRGLQGVADRRGAPPRFARTSRSRSRFRCTVGRTAQRIPKKNRKPAP